MFTLAAFIESQDAGGAFVNIAASADQHLTQSGDDIQVPANWNNIIAKMAYIGTTGTRVYLTSPSLRLFNNVPVTPVNQVLVPTGNDVIDFHPNSPIPIVASEELSCLYYADPAAAEVHAVGVWLAEGEISSVSANIRSVQFSVTITPDAGYWCSANISLDEDLPAGTYQIVGARLETAAAVFARWILTGLPQRPGFPCVADEDFVHVDHFRYGELGVWGSFLHNQLPKIELLCVAEPGESTYRGIIDLVSA